MFVLDYDCMTAAGLHKEALIQALRDGRICSHHAEKDEWKQSSVPAGGLVCTIPFAHRQDFSYQELISQNLQTLAQRVLDKLGSPISQELSQKKVGLFFASTKGFIEDYIYSSDAKSIRNSQDPFFKITETFKKLQPKINFTKSLTLSNACCSSHVAFEYVKELFSSQQLDYAFVIAADLIGPFVYQGFNSLKVLSHTQNLPFSGSRDGLQLGEAVSLILFSREANGSKLQISQVKSDTEGSSITRPSVNGLGLVRTLKKLGLQKKPDFIIAHGTGTIFNDLAEDLALKDFLSQMDSSDTPITNSKWSIGHTLGASGSIDLIVASEILKSQHFLPMRTAQARDPKLKMNYAFNVTEIPQKLTSAVVTSLGFGGVHASLSLEKSPQ